MVCLCHTKLDMYPLPCLVYCPPGAEAGGDTRPGHVLALCLSRGRSARPKGKGWQPEQWLPPNTSRRSTQVCSHGDGAAL